MRRGDSYHQDTKTPRGHSWCPSRARREEAAVGVCEAAQLPMRGLGVSLCASVVAKSLCSCHGLRAVVVLGTSREVEPRYREESGRGSHFTALADKKGGMA